MKRRTYLATVTKVGTGEFVDQKTTYARNSGIRTTEAIVREFARANGSPYVSEGPEPGNPETRVYTRHWSSVYPGPRLIAEVREVTA